MMYVGKQLARIHIGKKELGLSDEDYEAFLFGLTGKTSSKDMTQFERAAVIAKMKAMGAFKQKPLTGQQKACVAKWYELRRLGEVNSKDKSALNKYIKNHFGKNLVGHLTAQETNQLLGMLEGWIQKSSRNTNNNGSEIIKQR